MGGERYRERERRQKERGAGQKSDEDAMDDWKKERLCIQRIINSIRY
jgi:hypothetical protein